MKRPLKIKPGEAAAKLLAIRKKLKSKRRGLKIPISENLKKHLYIV
ncbi:MAG: hypothetical protein HZB61_09695 [Nitrospirae bacterium]|nr:hypothetical protein [Nitrospirota bacterium]